MCLDEIYEKKGKVETGEYGKNKAAVKEALREQTLLRKNIDDYGEDVQKMLAQVCTATDITMYIYDNISGCH